MEGSILELSEIDPCPKCKKRAGFIWHWSHLSWKTGEGYQECKNCKAEFH